MSTSSSHESVDQSHSGAGVARQRTHSTVVYQGEDSQDVIDLNDLNAEDKALAQKFGYKPVFKRDFGFFAAFSFAASISACFATIVTTFSYPLYAGGAASAVWCWLISGAGCMCIAASVSELVSAYPTAGGLYFTVSRLAPVDWIASISWITGWLNLIGQICGVASTEYGAAGILLAAVSLGSNGSYIPTTNHTVGVQAAMVVFHGFINSMSTKWLAKLTTTYIVFHMLALVTCSIALLVCCPDRHDATYVFTNVTPDSGWTPVGFSFLFGFLSVSWTMTDYDATAHIAEEIDEPEKKAPWAIFLAMGLTYVVGWLFTIVLAFTMGDPITLLENELEQPVIQLFYNNLGKTGAIVFAVCAFIILNSCCIAALQSLSRTVFAYSRDRLIPGSRYLKIVNKSTGTPIIAVWWSVFWCAAINLIALGSYEAIEAIFNVTAIAMDWSYCIPIFCKIFFGKFQPGPWYMGKWGVVVNAYACIWTAFVSIIFLFPNFQPVTVDTMNWAIVVLAGIFVLSTIWWYISGRKNYIGPISETHIVEGVVPVKEEELNEKPRLS